MAATDHRLPTEFYLAESPGSGRAVEQMCAVAAAQPRSEAVSVAPANVGRAAELLFGTGLGVVASFDNDDLDDLVDLARLSVATGATEIALPLLVLDDSAALIRIRSVLGTSTPVTIDVTMVDGGVDFDRADEALRLGANFLSYAPGRSTSGFSAPHQVTELVARVRAHGAGAVKIASTNDHHLIVLRDNRIGGLAEGSRVRVPFDSSIA